VERLKRRPGAHPNGPRGSLSAGTRNLITVLTLIGAVGSLLTGAVIRVIGPRILGIASLVFGALMVPSVFLANVLAILAFLLLALVGIVLLSRPPFEGPETPSPRGPTERNRLRKTRRRETKQAFGRSRRQQRHQVASCRRESLFPHGPGHHPQDAEARHLGGGDHPGNLRPVEPKEDLHGTLPGSARKEPSHGAIVCLKRGDEKGWYIAWALVPHIP